VQRASSGEPAWLKAARADAFDRFATLGMPDPKDEVWRYLDFDFEVDDFALPAGPGPGLAPTALGRAAGVGLAVVDGIADGGGVSGPGYALSPLAGTLRDSGEGLEGRFGAAPVEDKFAAGHRAFASDGAYLRVDAGVALTEALFVDVQSVTPDGVTFPHVLIDIGPNAEASLVVELRSEASLSALVVPEVEVFVGDGSNLRLTLIQSWGAGTTAIARARADVGRDANLTLAEAGLGGALSRLHLAVDLSGRGSSANIVGAFFGDREQTLDYRYFMRHAGENTASDMFLKGAVEDEALSIFTGMIRIEEEAQRTNAFQTNRNLLLSDDASAQSVPNLEILANDVRCGHASTVGPLDADQRYYLMSRGLGQNRADRLQVRGFFEEALAKFPEQSVTGPVREVINAKYVEAQKEGRV
jgi:Fe-S cluster assembly protein SufD